MHLVMIGGSDAGISAALRARELDPSADVTVVVADAYPNFSICGIPYYVSGEVAHWRNLAHRTVADLEATGMALRLDTTARRIDVSARKLQVTRPDGQDEVISYDKLVIGTGAVPVRPPIAGLAGPDALGSEDGVHVLHTMGDTFAVMRTLEGTSAASAVIVGAGYVGLEMADALISRGLAVTQIEQLPEVLATVDTELGALVHAELAAQGVNVLTSTTARRISRNPSTGKGRLRVDAQTAAGKGVERIADIVLVVTGVRPDTELAKAAGATLGVRGAIQVDRAMQTGLADVLAAGDCVVTHHRLLGKTYLPLGTTAHKQGRVAGENALGASRQFAGSLGTQVVKIFDQAAARTGLRHDEAAAAGFDPITVQSEADDHKAYYPGSHRITMRVTGDRRTGRLLGLQLFGHKHAEIAKRIDIAATAIFNNMTVGDISDLDLSYTPPLGSPWEAVQMGAQAWDREVQPPAHKESAHMASHAMTQAERMCLHSAARDLHTEFRGIFGQETIESLLFDSYDELASTATVTRWLVVGAERFARQRLQALAHTESTAKDKLPAVLFLCVHNAGRSQMALGWFNHLAGDRAVAWSGGSEPVSGINSDVLATMAEVGIDISQEFSKPWTDEFVLAADVVITMGCGDACPLLPGKHYEDWELDDPAGKTLEEIRPIRDEIKDRVANLLEKLASM